MYLITFAIVTAFIAFLLYSFIYLATPKKKIYDFIIIHGAGLRDGESRELTRPLKLFITPVIRTLRLFVVVDKGQMRKFLKLKPWQIALHPIRKYR